MADGMNIAALSMLNDMQHMSNIGQNITNALTPGFKRQVAFNDVMSILHSGRSDQAMTVALPRAAASMDMRQGTLRQTNNPLDLMIDGAGFFEIQQGGKVFFTRQGNFTVDADGTLVTPDGAQVSAVGGALRLSGPNPTVDRLGGFFENGKPVGQIKIVQFVDQSKLVYVGEGRYAQSDAEIKREEKFAVRQGQLENSNVNTMHEMVRMIETMRHFESGQKVIQMYDEMNERVISKLGEF